MADITVILPCAGAGSRMGLDSPKELFEIHGKKLIDFSLHHIRAYPGSLRVIVVVRPDKLNVAQYVGSQLPYIPVQPVLFDDRYHEWPGSVYSAHPFFSERNLVLLPDSFLSLSTLSLGDRQEMSLNLPVQPVTKFPQGPYQGWSLIQAASALLQHSSVMFAWLPCQDPALLSSMGAVHVQGGIVNRFQDKPQQGFERFNGFWTCYAFTRQYGLPLYRFLIASLRHQSPLFEQQSFFPPAALPVGQYYDLGTPQRVAAFCSAISFS